MDYKILAIDFDGTISLGNWPEVGPANDRLISYLLDRKRYGDKLILWTCRAGAALDAAIAFCAQHGLHFDAVNDNLPEIVERYGSNSQKSLLITTSTIAHLQWSQCMGRRSGYSLN